MKTENFIKLINAFTGREFTVDTDDKELVSGNKYYIYKVLPLSKRKIGFDFIIPKNEETIIKSFINTFCKKYLEPNPANYDHKYGDTEYRWAEKTEEQKEFCYYNHRSNMYSPKTLMEQVKANLSNSDIEDVLYKYGFYTTNYGIGIFVLFSTIYELNVIKSMADYLRANNIPFRNEFSDARWVYRFVINISKEIHERLLDNFKVEDR